jgi:high-affinity iron transporter
VVTYLLAAVVLTYMTFWMQSHSRTMKSDLMARSDAALDGGARWGLGILAFQAVGREGLETMVFTLAIVFASTNQAGTPVGDRSLLLGAVLGLAVALAIAYVIFRLGRRLNLGLFFRVIGVVLMVFAAGLLADAVQGMQELGWLPFGEQVLWDSQRYLSESSNIGDAFHGLVGYADHPTVLQAVVWLTYVTVTTSAFLVMGRRSRSSAARPPVPAPDVPAVATADELAVPVPSAAADPPPPVPEPAVGPTGT